jgi:tRNA(adenine34) deaminase
MLPPGLGFISVSPKAWKLVENSKCPRYYFDLKEAKKAFEEDEIPVGAVVVVNEKIIARGHNMTERLNDPTAHAEMIALTSAFNSLGSKYLPDATLYVTVEPCFMCAGAIYWSKIGKNRWN